MDKRKCGEFIHPTKGKLVTFLKQVRVMQPAGNNYNVGADVFFSGDPQYHVLF